MTVLLTGAAGRIGATLRESLPELGWPVRCFDREPINDPARDIPACDSIVGDLGSRADLDAAMAGVDAIVHLAGMPTEAPWPVIRAANIDGLVNVFESARRAGVRRIVWASSNHAVGFTPNDDPEAATPGGELPADLAPRPDTLYGVSKVFGEALGRYYVERYGMQVACLRIGTFIDRPHDVRTLSTWLSPADCTRLVAACLSAPNLTYSIVWGVSANTRRRWSLDAGRALGYEPCDDAELFAASLAAPAPDPSDAYVGGGFTSPGFGIDEVLARSGEQA